MITSIQVFTLTGKDHKEVLRNIREEIVALAMVLQEPTPDTLRLNCVGGKSPPTQFKHNEDEDVPQNARTYANESCIATLSSYKDAQGNLRPQYELSEPFAMHLMAGYGKEARKKVFNFLGKELADAKAHAEYLSEELASLKALDLDLDARLALRNVSEEHDFAQEYLTAYLAECKATGVKPISVLRKQREYAKQALQNRKLHQKALAETIGAGIMSGKPMKAIRNDLMAVKARKTPLKNLTLSKHQLMSLV